MNDGKRPRVTEQLTFNPSLIGFYVCCTVVGIASAVAAAAWIVLSEYAASTPAAIVSCVLIAISAPLAVVFLRRARREA